MHGYVLSPGGVIADAAARARATRAAHGFELAPEEPSR
jgi:hypothetical protein